VTDTDDLKATYSSYGDWVDISAPGNPVRHSEAGSTGLPELIGPSFSGGLVAGAAALVWSVDLSLSNADVEEVLLKSADNIDNVNPSLQGKLGSGRINVLKAIHSLQNR
jgi:subtilisin family serine protease